MSKTYLWLMYDLSHVLKPVCQPAHAYALYASTKFNKFLFLSNSFSSAMSFLRIGIVTPFFLCLFFLFSFLFSVVVIVVVFLFFSLSSCAAHQN